MKVRLSQDELIEAVNLLLRSRGDVPEGAYGRMTWKFGITGDPVITLVGKHRDAGKVYLDCEWETFDNVVSIK